MLGRIANGALRNDEFDWERCRQRISYLNSLDALYDVVLETNDVVVADRDTYLYGEEVNFSVPEQSFRLWASHFDLLPGYIRKPDGTPVMEQATELFACARGADGADFLIPMKSVKNIRKYRRSCE